MLHGPRPTTSLAAGRTDRDVGGGVLTRCDLIRYGRASSRNGGGVFAQRGHLGHHPGHVAENFRPIVVRVLLQRR